MSTQQDTRPPVSALVSKFEQTRLHRSTSFQNGTSIPHTRPRSSSAVVVPSSLSPTSASSAEAQTKAKLIAESIEKQSVKSPQSAEGPGKPCWKPTPLATISSVNNAEEFAPVGAKATASPVSPMPATTTTTCSLSDRVSASAAIFPSTKGESTSTSGSSIPTLGNLAKIKQMLEGQMSSILQRQQQAALPRSGSNPKMVNLEMNSTNVESPPTTSDSLEIVVHEELYRIKHATTSPLCLVQFKKQSSTIGTLGIYCGSDDSIETVYEHTLDTSNNRYLLIQEMQSKRRQGVSLSATLIQKNLTTETVSELVTLIADYEEQINDLRMDLEDAGLISDTNAAKNFKPTSPISPAFGSRSESLFDQSTSALENNPLFLWTKQDIKRLLDVLYFFSDPKKQTRSTRKKRVKVIRSGRYTLPSGDSLKKAFTTQCTSGGALKFFRADVLKMNADYTEQLEAEVSAIIKDGRFDKTRRQVFEKIFVLSEKSASTTMKIARRLMNPVKIKKHYLNRLEYNGSCYTISISVSMNEDGILRKAVSPFLHAVGLSPQFGLFHTALLVGPWQVDWNDSSLCVPRVVERGATSTLLVFDIATIDISTHEGEQQLDRLLSGIAEVIARYNTTKTYSRTLCTCQHFQDDLLKKTGITLKLDPVIQKFLASLKKWGSDDMVLDLSNSSEELKQAHAAILAAGLVELADSLGKNSSNKHICFIRHCTLDRYVHELQHRVEDLEGKFPGEFKLLQAFDRAFRMRYAKLSKKENLTKEQQKELDHFYYECGIGCPFLRNDDTPKARPKTIDHYLKSTSSLTQQFDFCRKELDYPKQDRITVGQEPASLL